MTYSILFGVQKIADELHAKIERAVEILLEGVTTDGGHHKQHAIEQALIILKGHAWFDKCKEKYEWEDGIPS